jgi:hypothetical protein
MAMRFVLSLLKLQDVYKLASNGSSTSSNSIPEEKRVPKVFISENMKIVKETSWTVLFMLRWSVNKGG